MHGEFLDCMELLLGAGAKVCWRSGCVRVTGTCAARRARRGEPHSTALGGIPGQAQVREGASVIRRGPDAARHGWPVCARGACQRPPTPSSTPLHLASGAESSKCTKLLSKDQDPDLINAADSDGMTAAHWCAFHNHPKHLECLIDAGADLGIADLEGKLPIHWTANNTDDTTVKYLMVRACQRGRS